MTYIAAAMRSGLILASAVALCATLHSAPAHAGLKQCAYGSWNPWNGANVVLEVGRSNKMSWACNRAERQCDRALNRARKNGAVANHCRRVENW